MWCAWRATGCLYPYTLCLAYVGGSAYMRLACEAPRRRRRAQYGLNKDTGTPPRAIQSSKPALGKLLLDICHVFSGAWLSVST